MATDDMLSESATPEYMSANCSPPLQVAAVSSQRISPRRTRSHGHTASATIRKRRKVEEDGRETVCAQLDRDDVEAPDRVDRSELPKVRAVHLGHSGITSSGAGGRRL